MLCGMLCAVLHGQFALSSPDATSSCNVVVLYHDHVKQAHPVWSATAERNRPLVQQPQTRRSLASVQYAVKECTVVVVVVVVVVRLLSVSAHVACGVCWRSGEATMASTVPLF
jgi:hypothetical protein